MKNNSIENSDTSSNSFPDSSQVESTEKEDSSLPSIKAPEPAPTGPYPSGHPLLELSPPEPARSISFFPEPASPKPSSRNWTGWAIFVILLLGIGYWVAFKSSLLIPYYVGVSNIEWYTPLEKNQFEMAQPIYEDDGRTVIYQRINEKFTIGTVKPTTIFYRYKDNYLVSGYVYFEKLEDFEAAKKHLDFLYYNHSDKQTKEGEKTIKFYRVWWGKNHQIVESHFDENDFHFPQGHYLIFFPESPYFKVPETLNLEKKFPKVMVSLITSTSFEKDDMIGRPVWDEIGKKFYAPGLKFIPSEEITNKFNELYGEENSDGKFTSDSFKNVSKNLNAKYGIYTNIGSGRSWTTLGGVLIHEEFYVIIKIQIFDIESDQLIYTKEIRKDGFPTEQKLTEYFPEALATLAKMIQEAPPLPKQTVE